VRGLESKMHAYHQAFGWGPWKIFEADGKEVMHHCEWKGGPADFRVRWAETMVGDLNFELIEPLGGANPWQEFLDEKSEGISSIAVMFNTPEESERVKEQFASEGIGITAVGHIGDEIEWYFLDTEPFFKCVIESGSGHAIDFKVPHETYP
jgi:methylmalonyl-CoA/ethylmalonyl-CoA epimerase